MGLRKIAQKACKKQIEIKGPYCDDTWRRPFVAAQTAYTRRAYLLQAGLFTEVLKTA